MNINIHDDLIKTLDLANKKESEWFERDEQLWNKLDKILDKSNHYKNLKQLENKVLNN